MWTPVLTYTTTSAVCIGSPPRWIPIIEHIAERNIAVQCFFRQESRAIAGLSARCSCTFRHVLNFTTASYVRFPCHSTAFLLVLVCRLQWIICQKVIHTRKNQSHRIFNVGKYITWSLLITAVINNHRMRKDRYEKAHVLLLFVRLQTHPRVAMYMGGPTHDHDYYVHNARTISHR